MKFFDNVSGAQKIGLILVVTLIGVRIVFPEVAQWALDGIKDMIQATMDLLSLNPEV